MSWCLPFVDGDDLSLAYDVSVDRGEQIGAREPRLQAEIGVERVDDEVIVMRLARRRRRAAVDRAPETGDPLDPAPGLRRHPPPGLDRGPFPQPPGRPGKL